MFSLFNAGLSGKGVPSGWRQARETAQVSTVLYRRLSEHTASISALAVDVDGKSGNCI